MRQDLGTTEPRARTSASVAAAEAVAVDDGHDLDGVPMSRAAWAAILVGGAGVIAVSCLFAFGSPLLTFVGGDLNDAVGLVLAMLLWLSAGGYGMLAFYGLRLRWLWARRRLGNPAGGGRTPLLLALADLRKIRWLAAAVLLAVLPAYLLPTDQVAFVGQATWYSGSYPRSVPQELTRLAVLAWVGLAAVPVLAARRAAWEIAAARGDLAGPADVPGFQVMMPGSAPPLSAEALPVASIAAAASADLPAGTTFAPSWSSSSSSSPLPAQPIADAVIAAPTAADRPAASRGAAAAHDAGARQDWEAVLLVLLVLTVMVSVVCLDAIRGAWWWAAAPSVWGPRYTYFAQLQFVGKTWPVLPNEPVTGVAGLATLAIPAVLWFAHVVIVVWAAAGLMAGPRFRRAASLLVAVALAATAAGLAANLYVDVRAAAASSNTFPASNWRSTAGQTPPGGMIGDQAEAIDVAGYLFPGLTFVALLVVMTRPAARDLFDRRVRARRR